MNILGRLKRSAITFPLVVITALTLMGISESAYHASVESLDRLGRLAVVRVNNLVLLRQVLDAENGQRGYLITGRPEYLTPYRLAVGKIGETLSALREFYAKDAAQSNEFVQLETLVNKKLSEMNTTVQLRSEGREAAWRAVIETDIGREQMDDLRRATERLFMRESRQIANGRAEVYQTLLLSRLGVAAMTALSVLALFLYLRQTSSLESERDSQQRELQAERDRLDEQVKLRTRQLTELAQHLQTVREDEKSRLARDLHDELGALLTAAKLDVARLKSRLGVLAPEVAERLKHLNEGLNSGIALKRRIIEDLRPSSLSNLGLVAALEILCREFSQSANLEVDALLEHVHLRPASQLTVYRLVQEGLTNIGKHAKAKHVTVEVNESQGIVHIAVVDDGIGFEAEGVSPTTHGLLGMRYRMEAEGGSIAVTSSPGKGTSVRASLPAAPASPG